MNKKNRVVIQKELVFVQIFNCKTRVSVHMNNRARNDLSNRCITSNLKSMSFGEDRITYLHNGVNNFMVDKLVYSG